LGLLEAERTEEGEAAEEGKEQRRIEEEEGMDWRWQLRQEQCRACDGATPAIAVSDPQTSQWKWRILFIYLYIFLFI
jgi:hypothetical protein